MKRVVVIGGGISGLAAAHRLWELSRQKPDALQITLLEAGERLGGVIETRRQDGFLLEGGPDSFLSEKPAAVELCKRIGLEARLLGTREEFRRSFIYLKGRLVPVPAGFYLIAPTRLEALAGTRLLSVPGKFRALLELVIPPKKGTAEEDESVASFVRRRLGREVLDRIAQPMIAGIYSADPEKLSLRATFPRFLDLERDSGSVIRGLLRKQEGREKADREASGPRYSLFLTLRDGIGSLVDGLRRRMTGVRFRTGFSAARIERGEKWEIFSKEGERLEAESLLIAAPAPEAARLLGGVDSVLAAELSGIPYESVATVNLGFDQNELSDLPRGFGFVVPAVEKRNLIGCTFSSFKFAGRATEGKILLRLFIGGAAGRGLLQLSDSSLEQAVLRDIREILGAGNRPEFVSVRRHPSSMPQYGVGHLERVDRIFKRCEAVPGLYLAGNAYRGIGLPDCIREAEQAAERAWYHFQKCQVQSDTQIV